MPEDRKVMLFQAGLIKHYRLKVMAHNFTTHKAASDSARSIQVAYKLIINQNKEKGKDEKEKRKMTAESEQNGGSQPQGQSKRIKKKGHFERKFTGDCHFCGNP